VREGGHKKDRIGPYLFGAGMGRRREGFEGWEGTKREDQVKRKEREKLDRRE
jgi:hypothetical protein